MTEMTRVSEEPADADEPRSRVPALIALGSFIAVMLLGTGLILIQLQVPEVVMKAAPWVLGTALFLYLRWGTPSSRLTPERRAQRNERRAGAAVGVLSACTVLGAVTMATYLTSWSQWAVLASFVVFTIGVIMMLHVQFSMGS